MRVGISLSTSMLSGFVELGFKRFLLSKAISFRVDPVLTKQYNDSLTRYSISLMYFGIIGKVENSRSADSDIGCNITEISRMFVSSGLMRLLDNANYTDYQITELMISANDYIKVEVVGYLETLIPADKYALLMDKYQMWEVMANHGVVMLTHLGDYRIKRYHELLNNGLIKE